VPIQSKIQNFWIGSKTRNTAFLFQITITKREFVTSLLVSFCYNATRHMECLTQQKEIVMLVLTRRPGESLILTFPDELDLDPVEVTILDDRKIGIDAPEEVGIVRTELLENQL